MLTYGTGYSLLKVLKPSQAHLVATVNCSTQGSCMLDTRTGSESNEKFETRQSSHIALHKTDNISSKRKEGAGAHIKQYTYNIATTEVLLFYPKPKWNHT